MAAGAYVETAGNLKIKKDLHQYMCDICKWPSAPTI